MTLVTRTRHTCLQWSWRDGVADSAWSDERRIARFLPDGTLLQETQDADTRRVALPPVFARHQALWERFLNKGPALDGFQMEMHQRRMRVLGPPSAFLCEPMTWRFTLVFTSSVLGRRVLSRSYRGAQPPSRALMDEVTRLRRLPRLETSAYAGEPVWFSGDLLLQALSPALERFQAQTEACGRWVTLTPPLPVDGRLRVHEGFQAQRFLPHVFSPVPGGAARVLAYDADDAALICRAADGRGLRLVLDQPLYRFADRLFFARPESALVVKDVTVHMPAAWLAGTRAPGDA